MPVPSGLVVVVVSRLAASVDGSSPNTSSCSSGSSPYGWPMERRNRNATMRKLEPSRSPRAVRYGMAELSGSIFHFHIRWMMTWAMYSSSMIWIVLTKR
uniref:Putative secreted peptide n=1 Tax=Anopheles braziliensis TaxID=58242 RepID=A0A2M3ZWK7_9DIPT